MIDIFSVHAVQYWAGKFHGTPLDKKGKTAHLITKPFSSVRNKYSTLMGNVYKSIIYRAPPLIPPPRYSPFTFCRKCGCPREIPGSVCAYHTSEDLRRSSQIHASNGSSAVLWKLKKIRSFGVDLNNLYSSTPVQKKPNTWQVCWYIITEVNFTGYHGNVISCTDDDDISHGHTRLLKKKKSSRKLDEYDVKWDTA